MFVYYPLIVDNLKQVAVAPVVPILPKNFVIGIWFGSNGQNLQLMNSSNTTNTIANANCVNGVPGSLFGQYSYCNAVEFFLQANNLISTGLIKVPVLGNTIAGHPCPTTRHFAVVDQDQSDNVLSNYIITTTGQVAQNTLVNRANLKILLIVGNGSDNRLLDVFINAVVFCKSFTAPNIIDPGVMSSSLALNELSAAANQNNPIALVPSGDPMVLVGTNFDLTKQNAYRVGVNQPILNQLDPNDNTVYCNNMAEVAGPFFFAHINGLTAETTPDATVGSNLLNFLCNRFIATWANLNCQVLTGNASPITVTVDVNGVAISNNIAQKYNITQPTPPVNKQSLQTVTIFFIVFGVLFLIISVLVFLSIYIHKNKRYVVVQMTKRSGV